MARKPRKYKGGEREAPTTGNRRCLRTGKARRPSKGRNGVGGQRLNARRTERFLRPCGFALRSSKTNGAASVGESARHQRPRSLARLTRPAGEFHRARRRVVVYAATLPGANIRHGERLARAFYFPQAVPEGRADKISPMCHPPGTPGHHPPIANRPNRPCATNGREGSGREGRATFATRRLNPYQRTKLDSPPHRR